MQSTTSSKKLSGLRVLSAVAFLTAGTGLFTLGAQPIAVGLFNPPWDKLAHVVIFALLGCAAGLASGLHGWFRVACCVGGALTLGVADELHQAYLPGRSASWADLAADAAGGVAGAALLNFASALGFRRLKNR